MTFAFCRGTHCRMQPRRHSTYSCEQRLFGRGGIGLMVVRQHRTFPHARRNLLLSSVLRTGTGSRTVASSCGSDNCTGGPGLVGDKQFCFSKETSGYRCQAYDELN